MTEGARPVTSGLAKIASIALKQVRWISRLVPLLPLAGILVAAHSAAGPRAGSASSPDRAALPASPRSPGNLIAPAAITRYDSRLRTHAPLSPSSAPALTPPGAGSPLTGAAAQAAARAYVPLIARGAGGMVTSSGIAHLSSLRALGNLPPVIENAAWSDGCWKHTRYMVKTNDVQHTEHPGNPWFTPEGFRAAQSSNLLGTSDETISDQAALDAWMTKPFHGVGMIDPRLSQSGYGSYREADGGVEMGACLDVLQGRHDAPPSSVRFPIMWPADGQTVPFRADSGGEYPDPLASCPGYAPPSGLPIYLQLAPGTEPLRVTAHSLTQSGTVLDHCVYDATSYTNAADPAGQELGRLVLQMRNAVVIIPRVPLAPGATYTVSITVNGQTHTWSFAVSTTVRPSGAEAKLAPAPT